MISNIRTFYKSQADLGYALRKYIDDYFDNKIPDVELRENISKIVEENKDKVFKEGDITKKLQQILGKNRLKILISIVKDI
ncbi:TIGR04540 family protein [Clostridium septicum]|uniref:TIGR04540 family protein n=1 Tax=Clostridium septicum TaxID=1504 RepID=A0A9N7JPY3_CLOSE|nr:TIGR04540 family protein [Clostridium septicum]AYE35767.1 hypothetical protein CP523_15720 [Clostridium septicum]MDU1315102.1 TIGR04540 family protein [Clostridium septicum]QAS61105.1 TIGR04540 family protein [Clostridium septicum]UEC19557.1 TIGR04540 family protein [Clostridium septicum]USS02384.1 TIGR04540 family protein [Clostridium septicum]